MVVNSAQLNSFNVLPHLLLCPLWLPLLLLLQGPVWQQLLALCDHSPACAAAARERMEAENESLRQLAASREEVAQGQAQEQQLQQQFAAVALGGVGS